LGLVIGLVVGAGGMYLALRPPWGGHATAPPDAGPVASVPVDAPPAKPKKKRRRPAGTPNAQNPGGDDTDEPEPQPIVLTEADRRLEWRGDEVALPAHKVDMGAGGEGRPLDDGEINGAFANDAGVRTCVANGATGTDLHATITVKMLVDGSGRVTKSRVQAPHYLHEHGLLACTQHALARMHFPATGAPTVVTIPVNLG
jgi:hypothetical protein